MDEERKPFEQLVTEKAGYFEYPWSGYIRIYVQGEERCECKDCAAVEKLKKDWDKIYTRHPIDRSFV